MHKQLNFEIFTFPSAIMKTREACNAMWLLVVPQPLEIMHIGEYPESFRPYTPCIVSSTFLDISVLCIFNSVVTNTKGRFASDWLQ